MWGGGNLNFTLISQQFHIDLTRLFTSISQRFSSISQQFHIDLTMISHQFHIDFTTISHRSHNDVHINFTKKKHNNCHIDLNDFASISHRFHTAFHTAFHSNFTTISPFFRAQRGEIFHPGTRNPPGTHPEPTRNPPGTGPATAAPRHATHATPRHKFPHGALGTRKIAALRRPRSFASPARTHVTHDTNRNRNRFPGWGHKRTHPPTSNIYFGFSEISEFAEFSMYSAVAVSP